MTTRRADAPRRLSLPEQITAIRVQTHEAPAPTPLTRQCRCCGQRKYLRGFRKIRGRWICGACLQPNTEGATL